MVNSRREFLDAGYYGIFSDKLLELVEKYSAENPVILDCGSGEGYYTAKLSSAFEECTDLIFQSLP